MRHTGARPPVFSLMMLLVLGCRAKGQPDPPLDAAAAPDLSVDQSRPLDMPPARPEAAVDAAPAFWELRWARRATGVRPMALAAADDALFVSGRTLGAAVFGPGEPTSRTLGGLDGFVARYSRDGGFRWVQQMGSRNSVDLATTVRVASGGGLLVGGQFSASETDPAIFGADQPGAARFSTTGDFLARFDGAGTLAWATANIGRRSSVVVDVAPLPDGSFFALGSFSDRVVLAPGTPQETTLMARGSVVVGDSDAYLARYQADGTLAWARHLGSLQGDFVSGLTVLEGGDVVLLGSFANQIDLGGASGVAATLTTRGGSQDVYFARYDRSGTLIWVRQVGGTALEHSRAIATLASGDFVIAGVASPGITGNEVVFGAGEQNQITLPAGENDLFFARYDPQGRVVWARDARGAAVESRSIAALPDGGLAVASVLGESGPRGAKEAVFGAGEPGETRLTVNRRLGRDMALAWYAADGSLRKARAGCTGMGTEASCVPSGVAATADGALLVAGSFEGQVSVGAGDPAAEVWMGPTRSAASPPVFDADMFVASFGP